MQPWRRIVPLVILILSLSACAPRGANPGDSAQAAELPAADMGAVPAAKAEAPEKKEPEVASDAAGLSKEPPKTCPLTTPADPPFTPPEPYPSLVQVNHYWHGTASLWTSVPLSGVWNGLPHNPEGYTQKIFWWSEGYSWTDEPEPELTVSGQRLDAKAPPLKVSKATNAFAKDIQSAMLVGVDFPTPGCWEISGQYAGAELSFVVWVAP